MPSVPVEVCGSLQDQEAGKCYNAVPLPPLVVKHSNTFPLTRPDRRSPLQIDAFAAVIKVFRRKVIGVASIQDGLHAESSAAADVQDCVELEC